MDPMTALHAAARAVEKIEQELMIDRSKATSRAVLLLHAVALALREAGEVAGRAR